MNSPVLQNILTYIRINKHDSTAIYLQIAQGIINAIQTKAIKTGDKLPGTRSLSSKLYIHRKTAIAAYDELSAQGWIEIIPQKGAFVPTKKIKTTAIQNTDLSFNISHTAYSITVNYVLDSPYKPITNDLYFTDGTVDFRLVDFKNLNQIYNAIARKKSTARTLNKDFYTENLNFKHQLINYLFITKRFSTNANHILTFQNIQLASQSILHTVFKPNDAVVVTDIGHFETNMKLKNAQLNLLTVQTDNQGISMENLSQIVEKNNVRALYIQTNNLYPTTKISTENSKKKLLELAYKHQFIIIEDDCQTDFVYAKVPNSALKSLDTHGSVIYLNSLKDVLPNPYDLAYIIAPENLLTELCKVRNIWQPNSLHVIEETIAEYIKEGLLLRQLQKLTKIYQKRRNHFLSLLEQYFEQSIYYEKPEFGLAIWVQFTNQIPLLSIANYCNTKKLTLPHYLLYQNQNLTGLRLGFGHLNEVEAEEAIAILNKAIYEHIYE